MEKGMREGGRERGREGGMEKEMREGGRERERTTIPRHTIPCCSSLSTIPHPLPIESDVIISWYIYI